MKSACQDDYFFIYIYFCMTQTEHHIIRTNILIKKVFLTVRFPCAIFFQIKHQTNTIVGKMNYELKNGICEPQQKLTIDADIPISNDTYSDIKVSLTVFMSSNNGKIPAGSVDIKITSDGKLSSENHEVQLPIQKCPDHNAKIVFSTKSQFIRSHKKILNSQLISTYKSKYTAGSNISRFQTNQRKKQQKQSFNSKIQRNNHYRTQNYDGSFREQSQESRSRQKSIIYQQFEYNRNNARSKGKLGNNNQYKNQISRLKNQIIQLKKQQKWGGYQSQLQRYRAEIDGLINQLAIIKDRNKLLQRKDRENVQIIKNMKQQIQKLTSKSLSSQNFNMEVRISNEEKESKIRSFIDEIKQLKEQLQDLRISNNMQQKRIQFKQTAYREQITKITEKYQQSQLERQKATYEVSQMLTDFQTNEKKNQITNKEKERMHLQQKNKVTKKNQYLLVTIEGLNDKNSDLTNKITELQHTLKTTQKSKQQITSQYDDLKNKSEQEQNNSKKLLNKNQQQNKQLIELRQIEQQYIILKKVHSEMSLQLSRTKQNSNRINKSNHNLQQQIKNIQETLSSTSKDKNSLNNKRNQLSKQISNFIKTLEAKDCQINQLSDSLTNMSTKLSEYRIKLDTQKMQHEDTSKRLSAQILYLLKTNQYQVSQCQQLKWKLQKNQQLSQSLNNKCSQLNNNILKISQELINQQQRNKSNKQINYQQQNKIQSLRTDLLVRQTKQKQLISQLKNKNDSEYQLKKNIKDKEQEIFLLKERDQQRQAQYTQKLAQLELQISQKNQLLNKTKKQKQEYGNSLNDQIALKEQSLTSYDKLSDQNKYHLETITNYKNKIAELQKNIYQLEEKFSSVQQQLLKQKNSNKQLSNIIKQKNNEKQKIQGQFQRYKKQNYAAIERFFDEINTIKIEDSTNINSQLLAFPDNQLSTMQISSYKKHVEIIIKNYQQTRQLQESNKILQSEIQKNKQFAKQREEQLQQHIIQQKQKYKNYSAAAFQQANIKMEKISLLEDKVHQFITENQKLSLELNNVKEQKEQYLNDIQNLKEQLSMREQDIKNKNKLIGQISKDKQNSSTRVQSEMYSISEENIKQIEKYKSVNKEQQKKISMFQNTVMKYQQNIQQLNVKLSDTVYQKKKIQKKLEFMEMKIDQLTEEKKRLDDQLQQSQNKNKNLNENQDKLREGTAADKLKIEDLTIKLNKANTQNDQLSIKVQHLTIDNDNLQQQIIDLDNNFKRNKDTSKQSSTKSSQTIKKLEQKIIQFNSELQLKIFLISQYQSSISQLKAQVQDLNQNLINKKTEILTLNQQNQSSRNQVLLLRENYNSLEQQIQLLQAQLNKQRQMLFLTNNQMLESQMNSQVIGTKERQIERLREQNWNLEVKMENNNKQLRGTIGELKKQLSGRNAREEEIKRRFRQAEKQMETRIHQIKNERNRMKEQYARQKNQMLKQLEGLDRENKSMKNQFQYIKEKYEQQIQGVNQQYSEITILLTQKEEQLNTKNDQIKQNQKKIKLLSTELKNCLQNWEKDKSQIRSKGFLVSKQMSGSSSISGEDKLASESKGSSQKYQKFIDEIDSRSKNLMAKSKKNLNEGHESQR